jgi:hypothetical protein
MRERRKSLARIQLLQDQLHKLSAWKLAALDQQRVALLEAQKATIEAIDRDAFSSGVLTENGTRRLRGIDRQIDAVMAQQATQARLALEQGARARLIERIVDRADAAYRTHQERIDLSEAIERSISKARASSA